MAHSIRANQDPAGFVVEVGGDIDATAAERLGETIERAVDGTQSSLVLVIDLAEASMLDSRSMGVLSDWQTRLRAKGGRLVIAGARPEVRRLFTMIGLEQTFDFFPSVDAARGGADRA